MRTIAQFNIHDDSGMDASMDPNRASVGSLRSSGVAGASSLRNMEHAPQILEQEEIGHQMDRMATLPENYATNYDRGGGSRGGPNAPPSEYDHFYGGGPAGDETASLGTSHNQPMTPQIRLPGDAANPMYGDGGHDNGGGSWGDPGPVPQGYGQYEQSRQYGLDPGPGLGQDGPIDEDEWTRDALAHMNLAGQMQQQQQQQQRPD